MGEVLKEHQHIGLVLDSEDVESVDLLAELGWGGDVKGGGREEAGLGAKLVQVLVGGTMAEDAEGGALGAYTGAWILSVWKPGAGRRAGAAGWF